MTGEALYENVLAMVMAYEEGDGILLPVRPPRKTVNDESSVTPKGEI